MRRICAIAIGFTIAASSNIAIAGPLTPPGAPSSSYKTLTEIEPRIAINATNTPGDSSSLYKITTPGSYYLTSDLVGSLDDIDKDCIEITASDVTIDLNGFTLRGIGLGSSTDAIVQTSTSIENIQIYNGTIRTWTGRGIFLAGPHSRITNVRTLNNGSIGIHVDDGAIIENCTSDNNGSDGIDTGEESLVLNCTTTNNTGPGIDVESNSRVRDSISVSNNTAGIRTGVNGIVTGCVADNNSGVGFTSVGSSVFSECVARLNTSDGFVVGVNGSVENCASDTNGGDGFDLNTNTTVRGSSAYANSGCGFRTGANTVFELCNARANTLDGFSTGFACTFIGSSARGNSENGFESGTSSTYQSCNSYDNTFDGFDVGVSSTLQNCNAANNDSVGFRLNIGVSISNSSARDNFSHGIRLENGSLVIDCVLEGNGVGNGSHAGVWAAGSANRISGCNFDDNAVGVSLVGAQNICISNTFDATNAGTLNKIDNLGSNTVGEIISAHNEGSFVSTNPFANIYY